MSGVLQVLLEARTMTPGVLAQPDLAQPQLAGPGAGSVLSQSVVVFSKDYLPLARINIRRAVVLLVTGRAQPLDLGDGASLFELRSPSTTLQVPAHIRLTLGDVQRFWKVPPVNRREVLRRDGHACQYCGSSKRLTLDHVVPRAQGGPHTWDNVVTACEGCNHRKGNRTPQEARMTLRCQPKAPVHPAIVFAEQFWQEAEARLNASLHTSLNTSLNTSVPHQIEGGS